MLKRGVRCWRRRGFAGDLGRLGDEELIWLARWARWAARWPRRWWWEEGWEPPFEGAHAAVWVIGR